MKRAKLFAMILVSGVALAAILLHVSANRQHKALPYIVYPVSIGSETTHVVIVLDHLGTRTLGGMRNRLVAITNQIRQEKRLQQDWRPDVLIVQPGLGSNACIERRNIARMALNSGKDFAISIDTSDKFKWPWESGDLRMVRVDEETSRRFERLVCAANQVWGRAPDAVLESQATRLLAPGEFGSITLADLCAKRKLSRDFKLNRVVCVGVPLKEMRAGKSLRKAHIAHILAISTPSKTGFIAAEPLVGEPSMQVKQRDGKSVRHKYLFRERWPDGQENPIPDLIGLYLREQVNNLE